MKPAKHLKMGLSVLAVVFGSVLLSSFEARADNWVEIDPSGFWYNSDSTYIDRETGFVVVEVAETNDDGSFSYFLDAIDCERWVIYGVGPLGEDGNYNILPDWRTDPSLNLAIVQGSISGQLALRVC